MKFTETPLKSAFIVDLEPRGDDRGFFSRVFCVREFREHGLNESIVQSNLSFSRVKGTLRGMHYQVPPAAETKVVRCTRGAIHDVIVDLRPDSSTYLQPFGIELTAENRRALYIPEMFAHGFLTLTEDAETLYLVGEQYSAEHERGYRHDDPAFGIEWPGEINLVSDKDRSWPLFAAEAR